MSWQSGRELASYVDDNYEITYTYDASGMRTSKDVEGLIGTDYVYEDGLLLKIKYDAYVFNFSYDASDLPIGFRFTNDETGLDTYYYYGTNSRGDVIALYNAEGTQVASYSYDAYGKLLSVKTSAGIAITGETSIAHLNPLRYRGYVYDNESGLYYLQSRYYDPTTCRFVNLDGYVSTGVGITGNNMFAYCNNNPVMYSDPTGEHTLSETCGSPSCTMCRPERREFLQNNIEWYNRVTGSNLVFVSEEGLLFFESEEESDVSLTNYNYIAFNDNLDNADNPCIKVWNSYIYEEDKEVMSIVVLNLLCYEEVFRKHGSWERNYHDMMVEWDAHNRIYNLYENDRCKHVDFDFNDREMSKYYYYETAVFEGVELLWQ